MKKRRADNENRDVKERLLIENFLRAETAFFSKTDGAGMERTYFVYYSFSSEAPTETLMQTLEEQGHRVCCPRIENKRMIAVEKGEDFSLSPMRIIEPIGEEFAGDIHVIVAPLLAADKKGNRLGYGGGYYDAFFKKHENAKRIGYAFDFQIVDDIPTQEWDERLDCIVTDKRILFTDRK
jgi:5-formyltetrahydrofolate cyclo-ligase